MRERVNNTWTSNVFAGAVEDGVKQRVHNTFNSSVFAGPAQNHCGRTKLGGDSQGTEVLFGADKASFDQSSNNALIRNKTSAQVQFA